MCLPRAVGYRLLYEEHIIRRTHIEGISGTDSKDLLSRTFQASKKIFRTFKNL